MPDVDLFNFFRWTLGTVVTVYAALVTAQWAYGWLVYLSGQDRQTALLRRYIILQALRLRVAGFRGDLGVCGLLCVAIALALWAHVAVGAAP